MKCNYSAGIGLIEVLVTSVVISVGLLAVASLQGDLMGGSRVNKTRAECQSLASTKIEQLRDSIVLTGYNALTANSYTDTIAGVTETFTRSWVVADQTNPVSKKISVTVSWGSPSSIDNQCAVQSVISFDGIGNSLLAAKGAGGATTSSGTSSLNANASTNITEYVTLKTSLSPQSAGSVVNQDGKDYIVDPTGLKGAGTVPCSGYTTFENNLLTRRIDYDGVAGKEAIELVEKVTVGFVDYCIPRIRYNGGVIIPISGIVHSGATAGSGANATLLDVNLFTFSASESGYFCFFKPEANAKSAPYVCYVGGNCQYGTSGVTDAVTECPNPSVSAVTVGIGGWRGKVGLLGVATNGNNVCFAEEITSPPETLDTARNYYTRNGLFNEGINKPYKCHDFLIINGKTTASKVHDECLAQANSIGGFKLASKNIQRDITGLNVYDSIVDDDNCVGMAGTNYVISGTVSGAAIAPLVSVNDSVTTNNCSAVTSSSYTCNIQTSASLVTINGVYNNQPLSCNLVLSKTVTTLTNVCPLAFTVKPVYTINGDIVASSANAANAVSLELVDASNTKICTNNNNWNNIKSTYTCVISTTNTTGILINATTTSLGFSVSPVSDSLSTLSGITSTVTGPQFSASTIPTWRISGSITLGNNVDNLTTLTIGVTTGTGTCSITGPSGGWKKNTSGTYYCDVYAGINSMTVASSPTCSNTKSGNTNVFKKYTMFTTGLSSTGTGQLVIDLGNVGSAKTYNISIVESSTSC